MKKEAKNKLTCDLDLWYYNIALVINQGLKPGSKYVLINYKECGSLRSPTPCLCIDFICVSTAWKVTACMVHQSQSVA